MGLSSPHTVASGQAAQAAPPPRFKPWQENVGLFAFPFLLYAGSYRFGLLGFDDGLYYRVNGALHGGGARGLLDIWKAPFFSDYSPVTQLTLWLDLALFGDHAWWGARLHGLAWFGIGTLGVRALVDRLGGKRGLAFAVAALYAVHPIGAQAVLWLAERKNLVALGLSLWSFVCYLQACEETPESGARGWRAAAFALAVAAMLAKPHAAAIPAVLAVHELTLGRGPWRRRLWRWAPFAAAALLFVFVSLAFVRKDLNRPFLGGSRWAALLNDGPILLRYLSHTVAPWPLALYYAVREFSTSALLGWGWGGGAWLLCLLLAGGSVWASSRRRLAAFGWLAGGAALAPALNLVPQLAPMSDHYQQWALPFWLLALGVLVEDVARRFTAERSRQVCGAVALAAGLCWGALSWQRVPEFKSKLALFGHAVEHQGGSALAWANYAQALASNADPKKQNWAGVAALRAFACTDEQRLLVKDRAKLIPLAAIRLHQSGKREQARALLEAQCAAFPEAYRELVPIIRAEVAAWTGRSGEAVRELASSFTPNLRRAARTLRDRCRGGEALPGDFPPLLHLRYERGDDADRSWSREVFLRRLWVLACAHYNAGQMEQAFDVAALLVNLEPRYTPGRNILAAVYRKLNQSKAASNVMEQASP